MRGERDFFPEYAYETSYSNYISTCIDTAIVFLESVPGDCSTPHAITAYDLVEIASEVAQISQKALQFASSNSDQAEDVITSVHDFSQLIEDVADSYRVCALEISTSA